MITRNDVAEAIKDYRWMMKLIIMRRGQMTGSSNSLVAKYGVEASLPKASGGNSDPVYQEVLRIEKYNSKTKAMQDTVLMIQKHSQAITDTRNMMILDSLLDGRTLREIASEFDMSLSAVQRQKDMIINEIHKSVQAEQMGQMERMGKSC